MRKKQTEEQQSKWKKLPVKKEVRGESGRGGGQETHEVIREDRKSCSGGGRDGGKVMEVEEEKWKRKRGGKGGGRGVVVEMGVV